ncbi:unnamed protein product [Heligmosomoides polygyrus]|uniref:Mrr_cat_2 domain-containing protein n=1 Tax=Heligmosomoides polygyrus TaxID=6339 RepID=A0A3P8AAM4_HELPZ|nr:unnamed protein product [Heligmosomoides polygyrus]
MLISAATSSRIRATELDLLDHYVRERAELQVEDLIVNDDNFDDDDRRFIRYEIQLKYNEGRYSAIYIVSKQICKEGVVKDASGLYALKTGLRNGSSTFSIKMKRELRILASMTKAKATWAPTFFDSGSVGDMPFIDFQSHMSRCPPALISIAEAIHSAGEKKVDVSKLKRFVRVGLEQSATPGKKFAPEWVRGGTMATAVGMQHSAKSRTPRETAAT